MKYLVNPQNLPPDEDVRSLRFRVSERDSKILRDTYKLIEAGKSPSQRLTMGITTIYPTGSTTGHSHDDMEEVYYVVAGAGEMVVGDDRFDIRTGDSFYVPPGEYHTTFQSGNMPLTILWVTGQVELQEPVGTEAESAMEV